MIAVVVIGVIAAIVLVWLLRAINIETDARVAAEHRAHAAEERLDDAEHAAARAGLTGDVLTGNVSMEGDVVNEAGDVVAPSPEPPPLTPEQRATLLANRCGHCGGSHTRACPRIKRIRLRADGQTPMEVEFWAHGQYPTDDIIWLEEMTP